MVYNLTSEDCIATATELTAQVLYKTYELHITQLLQYEHNKTSRPILFVSGGGIHNHYLMK